MHRKWNVFLEDLKIIRLNFQECVQWKLIIDKVKKHTVGNSILYIIKMAFSYARKKSTKFDPSV